jgi:uncharacterized protein
MSAPDDPLSLLDWKRRVFDIYQRVRSTDDGRAAWQEWRSARDDLFAHHPQSPLPSVSRAGFTGLDYYEYDPAARVLAETRHAEPRTYEIATSGDGSYSFTRFGTAFFELYGEGILLELYWLEGYGGGIFVPFKDATSGRETYGAGRYLLDTVKGSDLGSQGDRLIFDFNFAYNPSCYYDPKWVCPLAPPPNHVAVEVRAGERST